jgi:hypothetical protein
VYNKKGHFEKINVDYKFERLTANSVLLFKDRKKGEKEQKDVVLAIPFFVIFSSEMLAKHYARRRPQRKNYMSPLVLQTDEYYCEFGFEGPFRYQLTKDFLAERIDVHQVTIRDIQIDPKHQRKGEFTALLEYLLVEKKIGVQLEAVQPKWLKDRLTKSDLWFLQGRPFVTKEGELMTPCFARVIGIPATEVTFRLF